MEHKVKSHKRRGKGGKMITVKAHTRKGKDSMRSAEGSGSEFKKKTHADFIDTESNFDALKEYAAQFMDVDDLKTKKDLKERFIKELSDDGTNHRKEFKKFKNEVYFPVNAYDRKVKARSKHSTKK